jgi:hypothetical protein
MTGELHPYNDATFDGEHYSFPVMVAGPLPTHADYYRQTELKDRGFDEYCEIFGFDLSIFRGQRVLDLGAGMNDRFGQEASERGLLMASVNPNWQNNLENKDGLFPPVPSSFTGNGHSVSATAQELPFKDRSFDVVISLLGIPLYLPGTRSEYNKAFGETARVLAQGGMALMYPIPVATFKQAAFRETVNTHFDDCRFPSATRIPKLLAIKEPQADMARLYDYLETSMAE